MKPDKDTLLKLPPQSYWLESTKNRTCEYPALSEDTTADVIIVGGGIAGITAAYLLGKSGLSVALLEAAASPAGPPATQPPRLRPNTD